MNNIFKNAYVGKQYKTRDGRKAIYNYHSIGGYHDLIIEGEGSSYHFGDHTNGIIRLPLEVNPDVNYASPIDIVSEWQEEINEEELDKLAWNYVDSNPMPCRYETTALKAFKAGFRARGNYCKAMEGIV